EAGVPRAAKNRGDEVCQNLKSNLVGWAKARTLTLTRHDGHRAFAHLAASPSSREWSASSRKWSAPNGGQTRPPPCPTTMLEQRLCLTASHTNLTMAGWFGAAARASWQGLGERMDQARAHGGDRVWNVAFRPRGRS